MEAVIVLLGVFALVAGFVAGGQIVLWATRRLSQIAFDAATHGCDRCGVKPPDLEHGKSYVPTQTHGLLCGPCAKHVIKELSN